VVAGVLSTSGPASAKGVQLSSIGPLAFGPDGVLLVSDPMAAKIYAVPTSDQGSGEIKPVNIENIRQRVADMLGAEAADIQIQDVAANPTSGNVYLSVSRGSSDNSESLVLVANSEGDIKPFDLSNVEATSAELSNAPESIVQRGENQRMTSITDLAFIDGRVFIAGLSNEEFASKLRAIPYPFEKVNSGTSVEIYHGAHGRFETQSPVRTFAAYDIDGQAHLLAAYTCTPLVKFPVAALKAGEKIRGTTIAELGNRNRPLDMIVYQQEGKDFVLMANSSRGVMKITTDGADEATGITERINGTAGLTYETIESLQGVMQLDKLGDKHAVILTRNESGQEDLKSIELP
jgi:hypothetical protein